MPTDSRQPLRDALLYEATTGALKWRVDRGRMRAGDVAGHARAGGYVRVRVEQRTYLGHRVAWMLAHGDWPIGCLDHRNGDRTDNRLSNLREASYSINAENLRQAKSHSTSGFLGVIPRRERFIARIVKAGKSKHLGTFDTAEQAHAAYLDAKRRHHAGCTL
jgi:hypothetical protein